MNRLYIEKTANTPEINFSPDKNTFIIRGNSAPEDVRAMYYPVIEWIKIFVDDAIDGEFKNITPDNPLKMKADLSYFNSSSAKFFHDVFTELKRLTANNIAIVVEWYYDQEDLDQKEAGVEISLLVEMEFIFIPKAR
jgi:hypothetical protein